MRISELIGKLGANGEVRAATSLLVASSGKPDKDYPTLEDLCDDIYRTEVIPGEDSYGISPAENAKSFLSAMIGDDWTSEG
jgi:hypothetical protein